MFAKDIKINGSGTIENGDYDSVVINGSCHINGNINCNELVVNGKLKCLGNINCTGDVTLNGLSKIDGNINANIIKVNGSASFEADCQCVELLTKGNLHSNGICSCKIFQFKGKEIDLKNLSCEIIKINPSVSGDASSINGVDITLNNMNLYKVSGEYLTIKGNTIVDVIEFKEKLILSNLVQVKEIVKF